VAMGYDGHNLGTVEGNLQQLESARKIVFDSFELKQKKLKVMSENPEFYTFPELIGNIDKYFPIAKENHFSAWIENDLIHVPVFQQSMDGLTSNKEKI
jgi:hypothetical protein